MEEYVEAISFYCTASVEDFNGLSIVVTGDDHFSAEGVSLISGYERIARLDFVAGCGYAVCVLAAAFRAGTVGGYAHRDKS